MDLKLLKMLCKDSKQHHVMFHELYSVSSLLCIAQNVRFEIPYNYIIFKYYAWASYGFGRSRWNNSPLKFSEMQSSAFWTQMPGFQIEHVMLKFYIKHRCGCGQRSS